MRKRHDRLYHLYCAMKQRCYSPKNPSYKYYSKKGITVCQEWIDNFEAFREWALENGYDYSKSRKEQSLDRMNNDEGYSPSNCRFVTHSENCKNTTRNVWLEYNGERKVINDWSKETGIPIETIRRRLGRGLTPDKVLANEKFLGRSNTGVKGISRHRNSYVVYVDHKYIGSRQKLEDAILLKEGYINERK